MTIGSVGFTGGDFAEEEVEERGLSSSSSVSAASFVMTKLSMEVHLIFGGPERGGGGGGSGEDILTVGLYGYVNLGCCFILPRYGAGEAGWNETKMHEEGATEKDCRPERTREVACGVQEKERGCESREGAQPQTLTRVFPICRAEETCIEP